MEKIKKSRFFSPPQRIANQGIYLVTTTWQLGDRYVWSQLGLARFFVSYWLAVRMPMLWRSAGANPIAVGSSDFVGAIGGVGDEDFGDRPAEGRGAVSELANAQWRGTSLHAAGAFVGGS